MIDHRKNDPGENTDRVALGVLDYLERHPQAADTVDGVVANWLQHRGFLPAAAQVERVLVRMAELGVLRRVLLPQGAALYALNNALSTSRSH